MKARITKLVSVRPDGRGEVGIRLIGSDGTSAEFTISTGNPSAVEAMARNGFLGADVDIGYLLSHNGVTAVLS